MAGHKMWLETWFEKGVFILSGSLQSCAGGGIIATDITRDALERIIAEDPFVIEQIVVPEIIELTPSKCDARLSFLID
ncbi:GTP cyclohydrolase [Pseudoalteromonas sp. SMS1]|uniref:YciI family protein n=1 Tax=Pseudoalteromonas sp. SMS1 TaxID=2908894 RepID=UPI001F2DD06B|nr:GTP cyclohydrolase [Pseudoalteromonas sp. SMS1]MCF2859148.1 GTP cyclohydrolase [Pseudoalteromonas sp. SMS1]